MPPTNDEVATRLRQLSDDFQAVIAGGRPTDLAAGSLRRLRFPLGQFYSSGSVVVIGSQWRAVELPDAASTPVQIGFNMPKGWGAKSLRLRWYWAPSTTNTGDVILFAFLRDITGVLSNTFINGSPNAFQAIGVADQVQVSEQSFGISGIPDDTHCQFACSRGGTNAFDTFTGAMRLFWLEVLAE